MPQVLPNPHIEGRFTHFRASERLFDAPISVRFWHLASLDAPTVALVWSFAFAWTVHVRLPLWLPALQALVVWAVYVADRLLDARAGVQTDSLHLLQDRHLFHWRHRRILMPLAIAAAAAAAWIVLAFMPVGAQERNSLLAAASLVYFTRVHTGRSLSPLISKELLVGLLFTAGCALPAWSRASLPHPILLWPLLVPVAYFAVLAWLNCHAIDRWEASPNSAARLRVASQAILSQAVVVALAGLLLALFLSVQQPRSAALLATGAAAAFLLALLDRLRTRLTPVALRAAADLVLLTPLLLIPFAVPFTPLLK